MTSVSLRDGLGSGMCRRLAISGMPTMRATYSGRVTSSSFTRSQKSFSGIVRSSETVRSSLIEIRRVCSSAAFSSRWGSSATLGTAPAGKLMRVGPPATALNRWMARRSSASTNSLPVARMRQRPSGLR